MAALMEKALCAELAADSPMEIVIVHAPWHYGPNQPQRQTRFFKMIKDGRFRLPVIAGEIATMVDATLRGHLPQEIHVLVRNEQVSCLRYHQSQTSARLCAQNRLA
ncbi:hypothetical protein AJ87_21375 [Rhizobium yanglingense]|nr:hypothetical protein AJ87_21375 [Rhizobium yanglingense]